VSCASCAVWPLSAAAGRWGCACCSPGRLDIAMHLPWQAAVILFRGAGDELHGGQFEEFSRHRPRSQPGRAHGAGRGDFSRPVHHRVLPVHAFAPAAAGRGHRAAATSWLAGLARRSVCRSVRGGGTLGHPMGAQCGHKNTQPRTVHALGHRQLRGPGLHRRLARPRAGTRCVRGRAGGERVDLQTPHPRGRDAAQGSVSHAVLRLRGPHDRPEGRHAVLAADLRPDRRADAASRPVSSRSSRAVSVWCIANR
jgi:hypothetical protein